MGTARDYLTTTAVRLDSPGNRNGIEFEKAARLRDRIKALKQMELTA
jgi:excinuclease UvrABC nuclease subunit